MSMRIEELLPMLYTERITYTELIPGDIWIHEFQAIHIAKRWSRKGVWTIEDPYGTQWTGRIRDRKGYYWFDIIPREQLVDQFVPPPRPKPSETKDAPAQEHRVDNEIPVELMVACGLVDERKL